MLVYRDSETPINVNTAETFAISLKSIPSSGYSWTVDYDSNMIEILKPQRFVTHSPTIGGGGEEIFEFQMKQSGDTEIKLNYQRKWEAVPRETKIFRVHASEPHN